MISFENNENTLVDLIEKIESFDIFIDGKKKYVDKKNFRFEALKDELKSVFISANLMPAFGVSLHEETQNEMQSNRWLQINFSQTQWKNGLPFDSLLIKIEKTSGFNLIRLYENKYSGRCLFLALDDEVDLNNLMNN